MRKYLSMYDLFNKEDDYFVFRFIDRDQFINSRNKAKFTQRLNFMVKKFKIIKFQNDRKANIVLFESLDSNKIFENRVLTLSKFEKRFLLDGYSPILWFWRINDYDCFGHELSWIIKNKENLFKFFLKKGIKLTKVQKYWLREYLNISIKKNHLNITIKIKRL
jgi:hypothetical protein